MLYISWVRAGIRRSHWRNCIFIFTGTLLQKGSCYNILNTKDISNTGREQKIISLRHRNIPDESHLSVYSSVLSYNSPQCFIVSWSKIFCKPWNQTRKGQVYPNVKLPMEKLTNKVSNNLFGNIPTSSL